MSPTILGHATRTRRPWPTPAEISERAEAIRQEWTPKVRAKRQPATAIWQPPLVSLLRLLELAGEDED